MNLTSDEMIRALFIAIIAGGSTYVIGMAIVYWWIYKGEKWWKNRKDKK